MYEKLVELLRSQTVEDAGTWAIEISHDFLTIKATVKETASDRQSAWQFANNLCDAILRLGYEFSTGSPSTISTGISWLTEPPTWQGAIELRLTPGQRRAVTNSERRRY
jgi:hypothetical protein